MKTFFIISILFISAISWLTYESKIDTKDPYYLEVAAYESGAKKASINLDDAIEIEKAVIKVTREKFSKRNSPHQMNYVKKGEPNIISTKNRNFRPLKK